MWASSGSKKSTHLVCSMPTTAMYRHVRLLGGEIVTDEWVKACHKAGARLAEAQYTLEDSDEEAEEEDPMEVDEADEEPLLGEEEGTGGYTATQVLTPSIEATQVVTPSITPTQVVTPTLVLDNSDDDDDDDDDTEELSPTAIAAVKEAAGRGASSAAAQHKTGAGGGRPQPFSGLCFMLDRQSTEFRKVHRYLVAYGGEVEVQLFYSVFVLWVQDSAKLAQTI